jgi:hypothetical protein
VLPFLQATSHSFEVDSSLQLIPFHQVSAPAQIDPMLFKAVLAPALLLHARVESTEVVIEAPINHTAATARIDGQLPPLAGWTARPPPQVPPPTGEEQPPQVDSSTQEAANLAQAAGLRDLAAIDPLGAAQPEAQDLVAAFIKASTKPAEQAILMTPARKSKAATPAIAPSIRRSGRLVDKAHKKGPMCAKNGTRSALQETGRKHWRTRKGKASQRPHDQAL